MLKHLMRIISTLRLLYAVQNDFGNAKSKFLLHYPYGYTGYENHLALRTPIIFQMHAPEKR